MEEKEIAGFPVLVEREEEMYLGKFYLKKEFRGKGPAKEMIVFVKGQTKPAGKNVIVLNVTRENDAVQAYEKMGFCIVCKEKNDIGHGFFMDDYVMRYEML